jgi:hypothetical protein
MIKFGMTVADMIAQLTRGFTKQTGRLPSGLEKIKIQQEAIQRSKDMNKVLDMKGNPIDPAKPIMGGEQSKNLSGEITSVPNRPGQSGLSYETRNKEAIQRLKDKMNKKEGIESLDLSEGAYSFGSQKGKEFQLNVNSMGKGTLKEIIDSGELSGADLEAAINALKNRKADGGRIELAGGGMGRRGFLKLLAGAGAGITALKSGFIGMGKKAAPIKKVAETAAGSSGPPPYFFKLVEKIKMLGDDAPGLATLDRQKVKKYKDYELTEDVSTGEIWIQKNHPDYIDDVTPYQLNQETYMNYKPGENIIGKNNKPIKTADEYVEDTTYTKKDGEIYQVEDGVTEEVVEEAMEEALKPGFNQGGRAGYAAGKGVTSLLNLIKKKFGKDSITTADKIPTPRATLDRDMFKAADDRLNDKRMMTADEIEDFEMEIGDSLEAYDFDGTVGNAKQILKEDKAYEAEMYADYKKASPSERRQVINSGKPDRVPEIWENESKIKEAVEDIFPTGDYKYDAQMAAESLVENNPKVFNDLLFDDLDQGTQLEIYSAVSEQIGKNNAKMRQIKKGLSKPEKTLESMKSGKGIDMSDPDIADEFTRFMKENDPKGFKDMEQKIQLESFNPKAKGRKGNAYGGRIGLLAGGGVLKKLIQNLAKERGMSGSEMLEAMNWKNIPSKVKNLMTKEDFGRMKAQRLEGVERWKDLMLSQQDMTKNIDAGKNTPAAGLFEELEKTSPGYGIVPRNIADEDILQMEQMIKNMKTKDNRQLNAKGGIASMLGE